MELPSLLPAVLLRRYKRFLADVELPGGEQLTVHCPNTGAMTGCAEPGMPVWLSRSDVKTRKYPHTWELVETGLGLACIHSARANAVAEEAFRAGLIPGFGGYETLSREVKDGQGSRIDLLLEGTAGRVFVEVKSVTLCREGGLGLFPDAVSERGHKHLLALRDIAAQPDTRAVLLFCVMHNGVQRVCAAGDIDGRYRDALAAMMSQGVEVLAWRAGVSSGELTLKTALPFAVDP